MKLRGEIFGKEITAPNHTHPEHHQQKQGVDKQKNVISVSLRTVQAFLCKLVSDILKLLRFDLPGIRPCIKKILLART